MKIELIPLEELEQDLKETIFDIELCQVAIDAGVTEYSGGSVENRLSTNIEIKNIIEAEIKRREAK